MKYFVSIDQGGSKTEALIFSEQGEILAVADDRGIRKHGESYFEKQGFWIRIATEKAIEKAGLAKGSLSSASCALNGADWPSDYIRLRKLVSKELLIDEENILIVNDCIGAMRGGADSGNQAVLCLGTGANCAVRAADGREYIYGYFFTSIDQGGSAIGNRAWLSVLDFYNGLGEKTMITELLLQRYGFTDFVELYREITAGKIEFKVYEFCPLVMRAAKAKDAVAIGILRQTGGRMVRYIEEGAKRLNLANQPITLVLTGGVFKGDGVVFFDTIQQSIKEKSLPINCVSALLEPVAGAALLLLDQLEETERGAALSRFDSDALRFNLNRFDDGVF
ncbi:MAG: hypothetical protein LBL96_07970 [Clostridiales bacterium]|jgi:N-acetylglucosamine kinase-like BadF-type ATPase|nr:hypothetical protein [Clostridiales bacterium]